MNVKEKLEYLFYVKDNKILRAKIVRENTINFIVETCWKNQFDIVNKKTMQSGTKRQYYQHPFLAKESYYIEQNVGKIAKTLEKCKNPFLLRQIAHNLEIEEQLKDINYSEEILKSKGEN